jgi:hypothetical protein
MSKYISKRKTRKTRKPRNKNKYNKTKKGGLFGEQKLNIGGIDLSRKTGKKRYNWKTGKFDDVICYKIGPIPFCKIIPEEKN